ncbi:hypothetical protein GCM10010302_55360 [Streptomyces polychromogenes]|uniref:Uncharacterized protein n=1 Tax=Streptomyces polychromogenes TaxID=67342 RepID=A0ABN0VL28_9ACTN
MSQWSSAARTGASGFMDNSSLETVVRRTLWSPDGRLTAAAAARPPGQSHVRDEAYFSSW